MSHPLYLRLPFVAKLDNEIEPGQSLIVRGQSTNNVFTINLATHSSIEECKNTVLHISCRIKDKVVVFNTLKDGTWEKEERHKCPLEKGAEFKIRVRCHSDKFEIFMNGKAVGEFQYRQPLSTVSYVHVLGDLVLSAVGWEGNYYGIPYQVKIPGNMAPQKKLMLTLVPEDDQRFDVNFLVGDDDIAFHFNPRFYKNHTVNNSLFGGKWGNEEVVSKFPFVKKQSVDLAFVCEQDKFAVYVNAEPYCTFTHRIEPGKIDGLRIAGQMELQVVNFE